MGIKGKAPGASSGEARTVDEDVSDGQSSVAVETHRSRSPRHIGPMIQPCVSQTESSEKHLPTPVPLKRRGAGEEELLQLSEKIVGIQTIPGGPKLSIGCGDVVRILQSGLSQEEETSGLRRRVS